MNIMLGCGVASEGMWSSERMAKALERVIGRDSVFAHVRVLGRVIESHSQAFSVPTTCVRQCSF